jgi:hypothetical protein
MILLYGMYVYVDDDVIIVLKVQTRRCQSHAD